MSPKCYVWEDAQVQNILLQWILRWDIVNDAEDWNPPYTHICRIRSPLLLCELHLNAH